MASGQSSDLGPSSAHQKPPGNLPLYQSSPVTVHVPYSGNIGNVPSPAIQHRPVVQGAKVGQSAPVIQKAAPAPLPSKYDLLITVVWHSSELPHRC